MLAKKVDTLTKAMEVEAKKMRREVAAMEKEVSAIRLEKEQENKAKRLGSLRGPGNASQALPGRFTSTNPLLFENLIFQHRPHTLQSLFKLQVCHMHYSSKYS
jgi:hypothetical protein